MPLTSPQWSHRFVWGLVIIKEVKVPNHCLVNWSQCFCLGLTPLGLPSLIRNWELDYSCPLKITTRLRSLLAWKIHVRLIATCPTHPNTFFCTIFHAFQTSEAGFGASFSTTQDLLSQGILSISKGKKPLMRIFPFY